MLHDFTNFSLAPISNTIDRRWTRGRVPYYIKPFAKFFGRKMFQNFPFGLIVKIFCISRTSIMQLLFHFTYMTLLHQAHQIFSHHTLFTKSYVPKHAPPITTNLTKCTIRSLLWRDTANWNYPRIEESTTSKTSYSRLPNTRPVKSTVTNTEMNAFVRGAEGILHDKCHIRSLMWHDTAKWNYSRIEESTTSWCFANQAL